jgi:uncharacterized protein (TIGR00255 family)
MTGFGRGESESENYTVTVELKSVNHRFKDVRFKMSSIFNSIEIDLKKILFETVKRGSLEVYVNFKRAENNSKFQDIDEEKVKEYVSLIQKALPNESLSLEPTQFLRNEFYKENDLSSDEELLTQTKEAFRKACESLLKSRQQEGQKLQVVLGDHRKQYESYFEQIESLTDEFQKGVEEKLRKRIQDYKDEVNVEESRLLQEVVFYLEKLDVHEEINRIKSHLKKFDDLMKSDKEVGRQIDFLVQELNRETNTIGSKSSHEEISNNVVQMKVQLEKIREQGLNLE